MTDSRPQPLNALNVVLATLIVVAGALALLSARSLPPPREPGTLAGARSAARETAPPTGVRGVLQAGAVTVERSLPSLAFAVESGQTLDARLPAGPFTATLEVTFKPGRADQAVLGGQFQGGQLIVRRGETVLLSDHAGDEPRLALTTLPVPLRRPVDTLVYEFTATGDGPHALRAMWQPDGSLVPLPLPSSGAALGDDPARRGFVLAQRYGCASCHASGDAALQARLDAAPAPILDGIGARVRPAWLRDWLRDPHGLVATTRMPAAPAIAGDAAAREDLVHYLVSLGGPFEDDGRRPDAALARTGDVLYHEVGCFACHGPLGDDALPPGAGWRTYASLGHPARKTTPAHLAAFLVDPLAVRPAGLMPGLALGPLEAKAIAAFLVERDGAAADAGTPVPFVPSAARAARGELVFAKHCASCHAVEGGPAPDLSAPPLGALAGAAGGCLAEAPVAPAVDYRLPAHERADLAAFLAAAPARRSQDVPIDDLLVDLERLDCTACHAYHTVVGPEAAVLRHFTTIGEADLGDEGRLPPTLTGAGARLTTAWMHDVLAEDERARPYLATRMPAFGTANVVDLPDRFAAAAGATDLLDAEPAFSHDDAVIGRSLVGAKALNCIQCHEIAGEPSTGTPGPDLALMPGRLRSEHFARWLHDPSRVRPGTRMPTFFVGGRSAFTDFHRGEAQRQIDAIWSYLSQGDALPLPEGLVDPAGYELVVGDRPVVFRTFMRDAGVRAIACGFPEQVHCAFDAERCAITAAWDGRFLSAQGAWGARGGAETNPGEIGWSASGVAPLWLLAEDDADAAGAGGRDEAPRFRGYRLDEDGRPVFLYRLRRGARAVDVQLAPRPGRRSGQPVITSAVELRGPAGARIALRRPAGMRTPDAVVGPLEGALRIERDAATPGTVEVTASGAVVLRVDGREDVTFPPELTLAFAAGAIGDLPGWEATALGDATLPLGLLGPPAATTLGPGERIVAGGRGQYVMLDAEGRVSLTLEVSW